MVVFLQGSGPLAPYLDPDAATGRRRVEPPAGATLAEILMALGVPRGLVAFGYSNGQVRRLDYCPRDGETIALKTPAAGG